MQRIDQLPPMIERDESIPLIEQVREVAGKLVASDAEELSFYDAALAIGCTEEKAEELDIALTTRLMRAAGAI